MAVADPDGGSFSSNCPPAVSGLSARTGAATFGDLVDAAASGAALKLQRSAAGVHLRKNRRCRAGQRRPFTLVSRCELRTIRD
jgi:hypothetical protein